MLYLTYPVNKNRFSAMPLEMRLPRVTVVVHVAIDDSGDFGGSGFFCLAGFVASSARWNDFNAQWAKCLQNEGLPHLHTSDFLSGADEAPDKKLLPRERLERLKPFAKAVHNNVYGGFVVGVDGAAYRSLLGDRKKRIGPEVWCFFRLLSRIHDLMRELGVDEDHLECIFDDSESAAPKFLHSWRLLKQRKLVPSNLLTSITFADDKHMLPLQAADMLACGITRSIKNGDWDQSSPFRELFSQVNDERELFFVQENWNASVIRERADDILSAQPGKS